MRGRDSRTAMPKGAAFVAPGAPGGTPAQRNLLPRDDRTQISTPQASEGQLRAPGDASAAATQIRPPPEGITRTAEHPAPTLLTDTASFSRLQPCAHSVRQRVGGGGLASFLVPASSSSSCCCSSRLRSTPRGFKF